LREEEAAKLIDDEELKSRALESVEQNGIVFIDEMDKIAKRAEHSGADVSREGVQRDLLPLIEGSTVTTKFGMVRTDHILFIASGAFHFAKPSDLIPELQGRLPIRVELKALSTDDFVRILTEPKASLTEQYIALMKTESVTIQFLPEGVRRIAEVAWHVNERTENIGARRLHTVMERLLEEVSYDASERKGEAISIDAAYVNKYLQQLVEDDDLSRNKFRKSHHAYCRKNCNRERNWLRDDRIRDNQSCRKNNRTNHQVNAYAKSIERCTTKNQGITSNS